MAAIKILFVYRHAGSIPIELAEMIVDAAEGPGDDPIHVGAFVFGGILEATMAGVDVTLDIDKYAGCRTEVYSIELPNAPAAIRAWLGLIGKPYSLLGSCLAGGIYDICHRIIKLNFHPGRNCSETIAVGLRPGRVKVAPRIPAYCITPRLLKSEIIRLGGKLTCYPKK